MTRSDRVQINKLQEARAKLSNLAPYMQMLLYSLVYQEVSKDRFRNKYHPEGMDTFGVTKNGILMYTAPALDKWTAEQVVGVLEHECWHIMLQHHARSVGYDPEISNCAQDIAINGMLLAMGRTLPPTIFTPDHWKFPKGLTWEQYYDMLMSVLDKAKEEIAQAAANGDPFGQCGSGAGNPFEGEPDDAESEEMGGRSQEELDNTRRNTASSMKEAKEKGDKSIGNIPGGILRELMDMLKPPRIPWHAKLRRLVRLGTAISPGMVDYRYGTPSRRQPALNALLEGRAPIQPRLFAPQPSVLVAIDTSGSMGQKDVEAAMAEVEGILRAVPGGVKYCACDAAIQSSGTAKDWRQVAKNLKGGGGTLMSPIFSYAEHLRPRPNTLVIFTDGCFNDCPDSAPTGMTVIWVLLGTYATSEYIKFGETVRVGVDEEAE